MLSRNGNEQETKKIKKNNNIELSCLSKETAELCGIEHPIVQGGMHYVGYPSLAAQVSNAEVSESSA